MPQAISAATNAAGKLLAVWRGMDEVVSPAKRQQAVMALAKRLPLGLRASRAKAQIVLEETQEQPSRVRRGAVGAGAVMLAALAVYEAVNGKMNFRAFAGAGRAADALRRKRADRNDAADPARAGGDGDRRGGHGARGRRKFVRRRICARRIWRSSSRTTRRRAFPARRTRPCSICSRR